MSDGTSFDNPRLTSVDVATLAPYGATARWPVGFAIYESGAEADGVFVVLRGQVVLRNRVKAGRGFVPSIVTPGGTFGAEGLGEGGHYRTDARAEGEVETLHLSGPRYRAVVRERPQHALPLLAQVCAERAHLLERLGELAALSVEQRLVHAIVRMSAARMAADDVITLPALGGGRAAPPAGGRTSWTGVGPTNFGSVGTQTPAREHGAARPATEPLELDASGYRLLCELVGATRESVSLVMARLVADGSAERHGNDIIIPSPRALLRRGRGRGTVGRDRELSIEREAELSA